MLSEQDIQEKLSRLLHVDLVELNPGLSPARMVFLINDLNHQAGKELYKLVPISEDLPKDVNGNVSDEFYEILIKTVVEAYALGVHHTLFPNEPMPQNSDSYQDLRDAAGQAMCDYVNVIEDQE